MRSLFLVLLLSLPSQGAIAKNREGICPIISIPDTKECRRDTLSLGVFNDNTFTTNAC